MQNEALAVAIAVEVKCREVKESHVSCTSRCLCCQLAHDLMITEGLAVYANQRDWMQTTSLHESSVGPDRRQVMRCTARTSHRNNTAKNKKAEE
jgi:hypothetical protein